ncbi:glycosyltransferase [Lutibacter sp.]
MKELAPICLFTYNRLAETKQTVASLQQNFLAKESELFIFSDGTKETSFSKVNEVRKFIKTIDGFKNITIFEAPNNKGLANSIISGVTQIIEDYGKVIVLEDDLVTSPNFLDFINQALEFYKNNDKIYSISGYTLHLDSLQNYSKDFYLGYRASSWGWGTWLNRWNNVDWEIENYLNFQNSLSQKIKFMRGGSDMPNMLKNQMQGKLDSWAIRWCFDQFIKDKLTVFPSKSKIESIGINSNATHTKHTKRFDTILDESNKNTFKFDNKIQLESNLIKEFRSKFSIINRLKDKLKFK